MCEVSKQTVIVDAVDSGVTYTNIEVFLPKIFFFHITLVLLSIRVSGFQFQHTSIISGIILAGA